MKEGLSMKRYLMLASLCLMLSPMAKGQPSVPRHAVVEAITCGEVDPNVVGDACLALVQSESGEAIGLVAPLELLESYPYEELAALEGRRVGLDEAALKPVDDADAIDVLSAPGDERRFFWWNGQWSVDN
jgi:hypothetical protein